MAEIKKIKPSLPKGTRDFLPEEVARRNYIFDTIKSVFRKFGFQQIDTPAFERLETLTGKYGEEGDRLLFKILNSGDPFKDFQFEDWIEYAKKSMQTVNAVVEKKMTQNFLDAAKETDRYMSQNPNLSGQDYKGEFDKIFDNIIVRSKSVLDKELEEKNKKTALAIAEKGLRYDLTVPLARYVVQHQSDLTFPFKRFHIAPVWRADRPQKGRYQEFYQCDADVIGSTSLLNEVELTQIYLEVFEKLGVDIKVRINSRSILEGFFEVVADEYKAKDDSSLSTTITGILLVGTGVTTILDKLDKIGYEAAKAELQALGLSNDVIQKLDMLFKPEGESLAQIENFKNYFSNNDKGNKGIKEIEYILKLIKSANSISFDPTLARGLNYYTGIIWEVVLDKNVEANKAISMGSLGGGGRYDNLTEMFGGRDMSGVGISFGIERIYDVMEELKLFPAELGETTKVLFVHFDDASEEYAFEQLQKVRAADIASEIYPGRKKLDKQMNYANDKKIPFVAVIGGDEMSSHQLTFKNMSTGEQEKLTIEEIIERLEK
jgi:histidyl-tRNA synthetase